MCTAAFMSSWVARFGMPATLTSDRGTQFSSVTWQQLCARLGIQHIMTTSYHPQAKDMVERVHRQLKNALCAREAGAEWPEHLPWVLLGLRAAPKETLGLSSAQLVMGQPLVLPGELKDVAEAPAEDFSTQLTSVDPPPMCQPRSYAAVAASNITTSKQLQEAHYVYMRRGGTIPPLAPVYSVPYRVLHTGPKVFTVEVGATRESDSVDGLKPHTGPLPVIPAHPAKRGHPKKNLASQY